MTNNNDSELVSGRLGIDPKLSYTRNGKPVCEMSIGINNIQNNNKFYHFFEFIKDI